MRQTLATDNFNRANVNPINGGTWGTNVVASPLQIVSNALEPVTLGTRALDTYIALVPANDQWAQMSITTLGVTAYCDFGILLRFAAPTVLSGYALLIDNGVAISIYKFVTGTASLLGGPTTISIAVNDLFRFEAIGTTLTGYQNGTQRIQVTDATFASGRAGLHALFTTGAVASDIIMDNFAMGDFALSAVVTAPLIPA